MLHGAGLGRLSRGLFGVTRRRQIVVAVQGKLHPGRPVGRGGRLGVEVLAEAVQITVALSGEYGQALLGHSNIVFLNNALYFAQVPCGFGLVDISDGDQAHFKTLLGLFQLPGEGAFGGDRSGQVVLGPEYSQISFYRAHNQILGRCRKLGFGLLAEFLTRLQVVPG